MKRSKSLLVLEKVSHMKMRHRRVITVSFLIILVFLSFMCLIAQYPEDGKLVYTQEDCDILFGEITADRSLADQIDIDRAVELDRIIIQLSTYARSNTCEVHFYLFKNGEEAYHHIVEDASVLSDNSGYTLENIELKCNPEDELYLLISSPDGQPGNAITVWMHSEDTSDVTYAYNSQTDEAAIFLGEIGLSLYQKDSLLSWISDGINEYSIEFFVSVIWFATLCIAAVLLFVFIFFSISLEKVFAVTSLIIGMIYLLVITPISPPDELARYKTSYRLSNYLLLQWQDVGQGNSEHFDFSDLVEHYNVASGYERIVEEIGQNVEDGEQIDIEGELNPYDWVVFLPQAIGISLARLLHLNIIGLFILGRACNLLFYSLCLYFAVKRTPRFKLLFGMTGIMPMTLHQAASLSYDGFINGMSLVLIASILKAIFEEGSLSRRDYLWILISGVLLAPAKLVYTAILLLVFLIPRQRFGETKVKAKKLIIIFAFCAVMLAVFQLPFIIQVFSLEPFRLSGLGAVSGSDNYSILYIFTHPLSTAVIFLRSFVILAPRWIAQCIGRVLSGLSLTIPVPIILLFFGLLILSAFECEDPQFVISRKNRAGFLATAGIVTLLIMLAEFLGWTSNTSQIIEGIQGRYFIPIFPLIFMSSRFIALHKPVDKICICSAISLHAATIFYILTLTCGWYNSHQWWLGTII